MSCSEITGHCLKLASKLLYGVHNYPVKLVARRCHRGYGLRRNLKSDVKPTWTVSLRRFSVNFVSATIPLVSLVENTNWGNRNKVVKSWKCKNGKGVREKQLLRWLGNTGKKAMKLWPGCVGVTARRWDGEHPMMWGWEPWEKSGKQS